MIGKASRSIQHIARGKINPAPGQSPFKVAVQFDEGDFTMLQQIAAERGLSFASVVRLMVSDGLAVNGYRRKKG